MILFSSTSFFFRIFKDRIFSNYCPFIIVLCSLGFEYLETIIKKIRLYFVHNQKNSSKLKSPKDRNGFKKLVKPENLFIFLLLIGLINIQLRQNKILDDYARYHFTENQNDVTLFMRINFEPDSNILLSEKLPTKGILYDMNISYYSFSSNLNLIDLEIIINQNNIRYLMIEMSLIEESSFQNSSNLNFYQELYRNQVYIIYQFLK